MLKFIDVIRFEHCIKKVKYGNLSLILDHTELRVGCVRAWLKLFFSNPTEFSLCVFSLPGFWVFYFMLPSTDSESWLVVYPSEIPSSLFPVGI